MIEMMKRNSSEEAELIGFKQGNLKLADATYEQSQDLSWLDLKQEVERTPSLIPRKEMAPPTKKRKENRSDFEKRLINQEDFYRIVKWVKLSRETGILTLHTCEMSLLTH